MKLPRKVMICGVPYKITKNPKAGGGSFSCRTQEITVSTMYKNDVQRQVLLHEIIECILSERNLRYKKDYTHQENGHLLFAFTHDQFEEWIKDLSAALADYIK